MTGLTLADIAMLACPRCRGGMAASGSSLACLRCHASYGTASGVIDLLPWSGGAPGAEWRRWRDKLETLQRWRRDTWDGSSESGLRQRQADDLAARFFRFAAIPEGARVLEVGCGGGHLRRFLPGRTYWGLDPLASADGSPEEAWAAPARLVRGVGERLPIADSTFDVVVVCETLDHCLEPASLLGEARRVLAFGGLLAVMQSVRVQGPPAPRRARLRAAAGRLKGRLLRRGKVDDAATKMHAMGPRDLVALVGCGLVVEQEAMSEAVMFLRAVKRPGLAPSIPSMGAAP